MSYVPRSILATRILAKLRRASGPLTATQIARALHTSKQAVRYHLEAMESGGVVVRDGVKYAINRSEA